MIAVTKTQFKNDLNKEVYFSHGTVYRQSKPGRLTLKTLTSIFHLGYDIPPLAPAITLAFQPSEGEKEEGNSCLFLLRHDLEVASIATTHIGQIKSQGYI